MNRKSIIVVGSMLAATGLGGCVAYDPYAPYGPYAVAPPAPVYQPAPPPPAYYAPPPVAYYPGPAYYPAYPAAGSVSLSFGTGWGGRGYRHGRWR